MVKTPEEKEKACSASQNAGKVARGILASQVAELFFMIEHQLLMLNRLKQQFEDLDALFGEMEKGSNDDVQILKIMALRKATSAYTVALNNWIENDAVLVKVSADIGKVRDGSISFAHGAHGFGLARDGMIASLRSHACPCHGWRGKKHDR